MFALLLLSISFRLTGQDYIMLPPNGVGNFASTQNFNPTPYYSDLNVTRFQCTYNKNELLAGGAPDDSCQINSIGFNIVQVISSNFYNNGSGLKNYTIKMRNIGIDTIAIGNYFRPIDDSHIVKFPFDLNSSVISNEGFNDIVFDVPFIWNGQGNILLDICYGVNDGVATTNITRGVIRTHGFNVPASNPSVRKFNYTSNPMCGAEADEMQGDSRKPVARLNYGPIQIPNCNIAVSPAFVTLCQGDSVTLNVTGANTYQWNNQGFLSCNDCPSPIAMPTNSTVIQVIGFDGLCSDTAYVNINVVDLPLISVNPSEDLYLCQGSIQLNANTGLNNYVWSNGLEGSSATIDEAGIYFVNASNNDGCVGQSNNITVHPAYSVDVTINASAMAICQGETVNLNTVQNYASYQWSNGATVNPISITQAGNYFLTVTDQRGCSGVSNILNIEVENAPSAGFTHIQTQGYEVSFTNTSLHGDSYLWIFHNNTTSTEVNPTFVYPFDAFYPVTLIAYNNCGIDTIFTMVEVKKITSILEINSLESLSIYPVPSNDIFFIQGASKGTQRYNFKVVNMLGQNIFSEEKTVAGNWQHTIDLKLQADGIYWLLIDDGKNRISKKLVLVK